MKGTRAYDAQGAVTVRLLHALHAQVPVYLQTRGTTVSPNGALTCLLVASLGPDMQQVYMHREQ